MTHTAKTLASIVAMLAATAALASSAAARDYVSPNAALHPVSSTDQGSSVVSSAPTAIVGARGVVPSESVVVEKSSADGFDWDAALVGAGGTIGVMILLGGAFVLVRRRRPTAQPTGSV